VPKFVIDARGRSLFSWAVGSLEGFIREGWEFVFVARGEDDTRSFLRAECAALRIKNFRLIELDHVTDGQATTALLAGPAIVRRHDPILIYNIDTYVEPATLSPFLVRGDGWLPCFHGQGDAWSFAREGPDGRVVEVREKVRISLHASVGLYWFLSFELYRNSYERYYSRSGHEEKVERYVAPLYNQLIADGCEVRISLVPPASVHPLGTPQELSEFISLAEIPTSRTGRERQVRSDGSASHRDRHV
jgi:hypothetical protein